MSIILGSNILEDALELIDRQFIQYYKFISRSLNDVGEWIDVFADPVQIEGSFQPVPRTLYEQYGLDYSKDYVTFFSLANVKEFDRDVSSDQIYFGSDQYNCQSTTKWYQIDEWVEILCVRINNA